MHFLAIDIGSSFIKTAGVDLSALRIASIERFPTPAAHDGDAYELDVGALADTLRRTIDRYDREFSLSGIVLCVQMHGLLAFTGAGKPAGRYVTWQDKRAADFVLPVRGQLGPALLQRIDRDLSASHTAVQLFAFCARSGGKPSRIALLGDAVTEALCGGPAPIHETNACSTGLYDVRDRRWNESVAEKLGFGGIVLPTVTREYASAGRYRCGGKQIPVYPAIGDQQAAILGCLSRNGLMLNVATGGQLIGVGELAGRPVSNVRPLFDGRRYVTVSGLPAGRTVQQLMNLFADAAQYTGGGPERGVDWESLIEAAEHAVCGGLRVRLEEGLIEGIGKTNLNCAALLRGALTDMADRYHQAYLQLKQDVDTGNRPEIVTFAGGLLRKTALLQKLVQERIKLPYRILQTGEETLTGLARYALVCGGLYRSIDETATVLSRITMEPPPPA